MVLLQGVLESAHHHDGLFLGGFLHLDDLETSGEGSIFLEVSFIFRPGGGGNGAQLATSQGGFQQIGCIALTGRTACTDQRMGFVDENNDGTGAALDLLDDRFEALLKLTLDTGAGLQQSQIEGAQHDVAQGGRNVCVGDTSCQTLDHRGLADARLSGENRIVLPPPHQYIHHLADLGFAAQNGVYQAVLRPLCQIDRELVQRRRFTCSPGG